MLQELQELALALGVAILLLMAVVWLREKMQDTGNSSSQTPNKRQDESEAFVNTHAAFETPLVDSRAERLAFSPNGPAAVEKVFVASQAGAAMQRVSQIEAVAHRGLKGDRYCTGSGYWSESDKCEVTLIAQEDLDHIKATTDIKIQDGEHRRNIVTRNINLLSLAGKRFRIGTAYFAYDRPRPPCLYIQKITEPYFPHKMIRTFPEFLTTQSRLSIET